MKILVNSMEEGCEEFKFPAEFEIDLALFENADLFPALGEEHSKQDSVNTEDVHDNKGQWKAETIENENKKKAEIIDNEDKRYRRKKSFKRVGRKRREANARERRRIETLNQSFVHLKKALPLPNIDISKLEILRLAIKWIDHLQTMLKNYDEQKELLQIRQMETSRPEDLMMLGEGVTPAKHACLYHEFPDLKNTLWEESIGLQEENFTNRQGIVGNKRIASSTTIEPGLRLSSIRNCYKLEWMNK